MKKAAKNVWILGGSLLKSHESYNKIFLSSIIILIVSINTALSTSDFGTKEEIITLELLSRIAVGFFLNVIIILLINSACHLLAGENRFSRSWIAFGYSLTPMALGAIIFVVESIIIALNPNLIQLEFWVYFNCIIRIVAIIWSLVLLVVLISRAHDISIEKSILCIGIGSVLSLIPIAIIVYLTHPELH